MQEAIKTTGRQLSIVEDYLTMLDEHIEELKAGTAEKTLEIADFAKKLYIHPRHLSNTIHKVTGVSPCSLYEDRLLAIAKELILDVDDSIASVARHLMYDPSNFSKFFKSYTGLTPKQFRDKYKELN